MSKLKFKKGDVVKVVVPEGRKLQEGEKGFKYGLTKEMVDIIKNNNKFTVLYVCPDVVFVNENCFAWDVNWLEHSQEDVEDYEIKVVAFKVGDYEVEAVSTKGIGISTRIKKDGYDERVGMLVSMARMLKIPEYKISDMIDILCGDKYKELEEKVTREFFRELSKRF